MVGNNVKAPNPEPIMLIATSIGFFY